MFLIFPELSTQFRESKVIEKIGKDPDFLSK
jgi:hypothetical protein